ncbi:hypothetical protein ACFY3M_51645 [Streptomyces mirabilis]|uniref:hypothetical protein n=1 Tax=Streptomyces mirabilis TaxID=68239 RepID=UPI0036B9BA88
MVDPISVGASSLAKAASSAVTKQLQSKAGTRLGSRDERRQVYARFLSAMAEASSFAQFLRLERQMSAPIMSRTRTRQLMDMVHERQSEMLQAYLDLRLVANPDPRDNADVVMGAVSTAMGAVGHDDAAFEEALRAAIDAQRAFTEVCRDDLWYLPQRWQVYRPAWWKARRWRRQQGSTALNA